MSVKHRFGISAALVAIACTVLAGCAGTSTSVANPANWITPYKVDVIQGNFISREQVQLLKPGMKRSEVRNVLGTPLVASVFHGDRWDYVFTLKRQGVPSQSFKYTVYFKGDELERSEGDVMPSESDFISKLDTTRSLGKVPVLEATEAQLKAAEAKAPAPEVKPAAAPAAPAPAQPSTTSYPPLESPRP